MIKKDVNQKLLAKCYNSLENSAILLNKLQAKLKTIDFQELINDCRRHSDHLYTFGYNSHLVKQANIDRQSVKR